MLSLETVNKTLDHTLKLVILFFLSLSLSIYIYKLYFIVFILFIC
jgi:hypothetical protein